MSSKKAIIEKAKEYAVKYPDLISDIHDFAQLAIDEIEEGESPDNEYNLFVQEIENLIKEKNL
jgi:hypothetical protein